MLECIEQLACVLALGVSFAGILNLLLTKKTPLIQYISMAAMLSLIFLFIKFIGIPLDSFESPKFFIAIFRLIGLGASFIVFLDVFCNRHEN